MAVEHGHSWMILYLWSQDILDYAQGNSHQLRNRGIHHHGSLAEDEDGWFSGQLLNQDGSHIGDLRLLPVQFPGSWIPSGRGTKNDGKSPCYQWVNPRTKWAIFNSELLNYQRVKPIFFWLGLGKRSTRILIPYSEMWTFSSRPFREGLPWVLAHVYLPHASSCCCINPR